MLSIKILNVLLSNLYFENSFMIKINSDSLF